MTTETYDGEGLAEVPYSLKIAGKDDRYQLTSQYEAAEILVRRTRQLKGLEEGEGGIEELAEGPGVWVFQKDGADYFWNYMSGLSCSLVRTSFTHSGGRLNGSREFFMIDLDHATQTSDMMYMLITFQDGEMTMVHSRNDQETIDRIGAMVEVIDGPLFAS
jgi:hypothetical protein